MKSWVWMLGLVIAGGLGYFFGGLGEGGVEEGEVSSLSERRIRGAGERDVLAGIGRVLDGGVGKDESLEMLVALIGLDAGELEELWEREKDGLDLGADDDREFAEMLFKRLGELDPERGLVLVGETGGFRYNFQVAVLSGWARKDWEAALEWSRGQSDDRSRLRGMAAVLEEVARWDREGALEVYLDEVAAKRMNGWWWNEREIFGRWAQDDPEGAVAAGLRVQEETGRDGPLKLTVEAWAKFEGAAAGDWVKREVEAGRLDGIAYGYLMSGWAEVDMQAAGDFGLERFGKKGFGNAMLHVMNAWAHCDFGEAASWVDGIADEEVRGRMQALLVSQSGNTANREPALEFALKHVGKNEGMLRAVTGHGCELATRSGAEVALAWGEEHLEDAGQLAEYRQGVLDHLSWEDPAAAAKQVAEMFGDEEQLALQEKIAKRWAEGDAEGARTWAESLPEGEEREVALLGLAEGWMADNGRREDAAKWAESFPEGEFRDQLTDRHARSLMNVKSIEKALGAASQIADPAQRELTFEAITKVWYRDEIKAEAAREFIEGTEMMSEGAKWRVLNRKWGYPD